MDRQVIAGFAPRIYCIDPVLVERGGWNALLARVAGLEFDHVLLGGVRLSERWFDAPAQANVTGSVAQQTAGEGGIDDLAQLEQVVQMCTEHHLRLLVDLSLPHWHSEEPVPDGLAEPQPERLPDPRYPLAMRRRLQLDSPHAVEHMLAFWLQRLTILLDTGVAGFCCYEPGAIAAPLWQRLIDMTRQQRACSHFLAWTQGCTHDQLDSLRGCGFDAVFSSGAWWDFRAPWYFREYQKLAAIAPVLACPDYPFGPRLARLHGWQDPASRHLGAQRALQFSAASAPGWVMAMGFEYGLMQSLSMSTSSLRLTTPQAFEQACATADLDFSAEVRQANLGMLQNSLEGELHLRARSAPNAALLVLERNTATASQLIMVNPQLEQPVCAPDDGSTDRNLPMQHQRDQQHLPVPPGAVRLIPLEAAIPVASDARRRKKLQADKLHATRIAIEHIAPAVEQGRFAAKRIVGERFTISADIFMDGHAKLGAEVLLRAADQKQWQRLPMQHIGNDRWQVTLSLTRLGRHFFCIEAWQDMFMSYRDGLQKKAAAGLPLPMEIDEGRLLVQQLLTQARHADSATRARASAVLQALDAGVGSADAQLDLLCADQTASLLAKLTAEAGTRAFVTRSTDEYPLDAERSAAGFASWYELFPRSQSGRSDVHGNFDDVIARLPAIRAMGFDTLYLPPIHPIGQRNRKGKNNSLQAQADDPGSPYAIGSDDGGHDAIHPQLGSLADFHRLRDAVAAQGMALALDFAIQCSPDHPWLREHPEWFAWRPDGSISYAENPPKRYEDIVNVDFYGDEAIPALWNALREVVLHWIAQGVLLFRVDNPHTKPLPFWEWLIGSVRERHPQAIFLAEAFTRPKPMYRLAKLGFSQSYTYFTWRHGKQELIDYVTELTRAGKGSDHGDDSSDGAGDYPRDYFRPHFFVNTPDINPYFLQRSGRAGFRIRAALAATLSGLWGIYSGFELCEARAMPGKEEYLDSEKYEIRTRDWQQPGNIIDDITRLNQIRAENPALQTHLGVHFLELSNDNILYFVKSTATQAYADTLQFGDNVVLVAINLDPHQRQEGNMSIPLHGFGLPDNATIAVDDLIEERHFQWHGRWQKIALDPHSRPYAIWRLQLDQGGR